MYTRTLYPGCYVFNNYVLISVLMEVEVEYQYSLMQHVSRELRGRAQNDVPAVPAWKSALWEANSVDPAMLRAPFLIIIFLFLWGINIVVFEKSRIQYFKALGISRGADRSVFFYSA